VYPALECLIHGGGGNAWIVVCHWTSGKLFRRSYRIYFLFLCLDADSALTVGLYKCYNDRTMKLVYSTCTGVAVQISPHNEQQSKDEHESNCYIYFM